MRDHTKSTKCLHDKTEKTYYQNSQMMGYKIICQNCDLIIQETGSPFSLLFSILAVFPNNTSTIFGPFPSIRDAEEYMKEKFLLRDSSIKVSIHFHEPV